MKRCTICGDRKPLSEFYSFDKFSRRENRMKHYHYGKCKECYHVKQRGPKKQKRPAGADTILADMVMLRW